MPRLVRSRAVIASALIDMLAYRNLNDFIKNRVFHGRIGCNCALNSFTFTDMEMRVQKFTLFFVLPASLLAIRSASAQYSANYQTNIISGVISNWSGDYFVGSNTFANGIMIRNGGVLANADAQVGCLSMSTSNYVLVSGAGSVWSNANMYLGNL